MDNPYAPQPRRRDRSPAKNNFQSELEAKMRDRKKKGLSAEFSSSDELASDDELMARFNMTTKDRKSPYEARKSPLDDVYNTRKSPSSFRESPDSFGGTNPDLMMTLKKPWKPPPQKGSSTGVSKGRGFGSLNEEVSPRSKENKPWKPPELRKTSLAELQSGTSNRASPGVKARSGTPTTLDSMENTPRVTPRKSQPMRHSPAQNGFDTLDGGFQRYSKDDRGTRESPYQGRKSPYDERGASPKNTFGKREDDPLQSLFGNQSPRSDSLKKFPGDKHGSGYQYDKKGVASHKEENARSPYDRSPYDDRKASSYDDRKVSSYDERKSPYDKKTSSYDDRRSPYSDERKASAYDGRKTPNQDGRKTPSEDWRKSPAYDAKKSSSQTGRKSPGQDDLKTRSKSKSPGVDGRRTPSGKDRISPSSEKTESRRSSVLDFLAGGTSTPEDKGKSKSKKKTAKKSSLLHSSDSEDDHHRSDAVPKMGASRKSPYFDDYGHGERSAQGHGRGHSPYQGNKRQQSSPYDDYMDGFRPTLKKKDMVDGDDYRPKPKPRAHMAAEEERGRGRQGRKTPTHERERESSLCREVERDPTITPKPIPQKEKDRKTPQAHTKDKQLLEEVIDSVADDNQRTMRFIEPDDGEKKQAQETGVKMPKHKPKPRYAKPEIESDSVKGTTSFNSTQDIKDAIYQNWYRERQEKSKQLLKEKKQKEKEEEEKKKKEKEERVVEAKLSFQAWADNKKPLYKEKAKLKMKEAEKEEKEKREKREKIKDSEMSYQKWKENKDAVIREKERKKQREEHKKQDHEVETQSEKEKNAGSAYKKWKSNKDDLLKTKSYEKQREEEDEEEEKREAERKKLREARRQYEKWLDKKEEQGKRLQHSSRGKSTESLENTQPPWSPAGNRIIPVGY